MWKKAVFYEKNEEVEKGLIIIYLEQPDLEHGGKEFL